METSKLRSDSVALLKSKLNFDSYEAKVTDLTMNEIDALLSIPEVMDLCLIKPDRVKCGSVFSGLREPAIVCGFMKDKELRILVLYHDRPLGNDGIYDFDFVNVNQVLPYSEPKNTEV